MYVRSPLAAAALGAILLVATVATGAQTDPNDPLGLGTKLGLQSLNNSGQVGTITLFRRGAHKTLVDLSISGVPARKVELASLRRSRDCTATIARRVAFALESVRHARSRTLLAATEDSLLSGNYIVLVASQEKPSHYLACGHLYR
jgi:hypothetical protein